MAATNLKGFRVIAEKKAPQSPCLGCSYRSGTKNVGDVKLARNKPCYLCQGMSIEQAKAMLKKGTRTVYTPGREMKEFEKDLTVIECFALEALIAATSATVYSWRLANTSNHDGHCCAVDSASAGGEGFCSNYALSF